ncbi:gamma-glutamyltransferase [Marinilactibacillus sp. Marseille-P9653]|uniref:gamma-glutamyltransferase n=1 Tax=Marinilactibacillus sp. Marseille-P9653 TaxID=2866583 RepID=UPI001CE43E07|nr:gamma-glutamyltransferase [Marinilactibacillus sp. Marseille-P9653]
MTIPEFDAGVFNYASRRELVYGKKGMVATSHPLASQAGLEILKKGGNAIDAVIAAAAALTVVEPGSNGIGGDSFSILWKDGELHGLNASGHSPKQLTRDNLIEKGHQEIPTHGIDPITVPGVPAGWVELNKKHGKLPLKEILEPAAKIAEEGFPVSNVVSNAWKRTFNILKKKLEQFPELETWFETFAPEGHPIEPGEIWASKGHARTLRLIGETDGEAFYNGEIAEAIDRTSEKYQGLIRKEDLKEYKPEWIAPISTNYKGYDIWEMPPNGQGIIALMALSILENLELKGKDDPETIHKQIEAVKLAFSDGQATITDLKHMNETVDKLLSKDYAKSRAALVQKEALDPKPGIRDYSGTVYLAAADEEGNMISYIQSNYMGFGSGVVVPEYGLSLQNRGCGFTMEEGHPNIVGPNKKPFHTIIPGFITKGDQPVGPFGIMGGQMQPQAHLQVISSMIDFHLNPQNALDAPRWHWDEGKKVSIEPEMPLSVIEDLIKRGHEVTIVPGKGLFGRGEVILRNQNGVLIGGTEPRADGYIATW